MHRSRDHIVTQVCELSVPTCSNVKVVSKTTSNITIPLSCSNYNKQMNTITSCDMALFGKARPVDVQTLSLVIHSSQLRKSVDFLA